jgi:hypothetical protein
VAEFLAELRGRLNGRQIPQETQIKRPDDKRRDEEIVGSYVQRLHEAATAKQMFDRVYTDLSTDRKVGKNEADAIAHLYTGGRERWPTKGEALTAIQDWFTQKAYQAVKMKQVDSANAR